MGKIEEAFGRITLNGARKNANEFRKPPIPGNEIDRKILEACEAYPQGMHYSHLFSAIASLVNVLGIDHDILVSHAEFIRQYVSTESDTMKTKTVEDVIEEHRKAYPEQKGTWNKSRNRPSQDAVKLVDGENCLPNSSGETYWEKFKRSILDQELDYPQPEALITLWQNDIQLPFLTLKSFSLWQGKQKSKKTSLLAIAIAAYIRREPLGDLIRFERGIVGKVLFFDNEQGQSYAARTMKLILKLSGLSTCSNLDYCDLRQYNSEERPQIIEAGIRGNPDVRLVVIDGIVDLMVDFMDAKEGHSTVTNIIQWCSRYNIHVAGVLHQNKGDKNARAHVGTISSQKCEIEVSAEVDPQNRSQSIVSCVNSRGLPFEPFAIKWEKGALPRICQEWSTLKIADEKESQKRERNLTLIHAVFKPLSALKYSEAVESIQKLSNKSKSTAKRLLDDCLVWEIVLKGQDGLYRINTLKGSRVQEGSKEGS
jgi:AAA domain